MQTCDMCGCNCTIPPLVVRGHLFCCWDCVYAFWDIPREENNDNDIRQSDGTPQL